MFTRGFLTKSVPCISRTLNYSSFNCTKSPTVTKCCDVFEYPKAILNNYWQPSCVSSKRFKSYQKRSKKDQSDEDDSEFKVDSNDKSLSKDSKVVTIYVTAMRVDGIIKSGLNISRNKIETLFYESKLRVNGKKILKKSSRIKEGDEVDVIKSVSPNNPDHLYVARLEVLNTAVDEEEIAVTVRRFKTLLIDNYEDPYKVETPGTLD